MDDLTITRFCAEAMGWTVKVAGHTEDRPFRCYEGDEPIYGIGSGWITSKWNPLHDDAQAMAMVKKLEIWLNINEVERGLRWYARPKDSAIFAGNSDLNRAICEAVAKMQASK